MDNRFFSIDVITTIIIQWDNVLLNSTRLSSNADADACDGIK